MNNEINNIVSEKLLEDEFVQNDENIHVAPNSEVSLCIIFFIKNFRLLICCHMILLDPCNLCTSISSSGDR